MDTPFRMHSQKEFEALSREERAKYIDALIEHVTRLRKPPLPEPKKRAKD